ncbi:restriction endonuclease [Actinobacillus delphinicola]|uniref:Restriction endonuclease n=1 Tax=Actinobacillus delphinicola TaxID=51161 RepID=A0A448TVV2_9PAST|nr:restriction endonuclease [Actinobacillus delphinicola]VEJ10061.1 restriction endonuclease [Actinobacillus delphinicola]
MQSHTELMFPVLQFFSDGEVHTKSETCDYGKSHFGFSPQELEERLNSGGLTYRSRIEWAITYLSYTKALNDTTRLLQRTKRATYQITPLGKKLAQDKNAYLNWYQKTYGNGQAKTKSRDTEDKIVAYPLTPQEQIEQGAGELHANLKAELLAKIQAQSPQFFERLVLKLLVKMGYGVNGHHRLTQNTADGGIDGIIYEDELGLNKIYLQAKCWQNPISRPELQKFAGAISDKNTPKGVFITTSYFSKEAERYAREHQRFTIALIDGDRLAELMIKYKLGVETDYIVEICRPDNDFFDEE